MSEKIIEVFGFISKEETVTNVDHLILQNTLVLEEVEPFKGYHGQGFPLEQGPTFLYLVTREHHTAEKIIRTTNRIKKYSPYTFDAVHGIIKFYNDKHSCIRIRGLQSYDNIADIQSSYVYEGVEFARRKKMKTQAVIRIKKMFSLNELSEGVFMDMDDAKMGYFAIPDAMNWKMFEAVTRSVKNNIKNSLFDAAVGGYFVKEGVVDVVRLYQDSLNEARIKEVRDLYLAELKRMA